MSEPIKSGDLVTYRHSCCIGFRAGVEIFVVAEVDMPRWSSATCAACGGNVPHELMASRKSNENGAPVSWLKRIPPLSELEGEKRDEKLKEPA